MSREEGVVISKSCSWMVCKSTIVRQAKDLTSLLLKKLMGLKVAKQIRKGKVMSLKMVQKS